MLALYVVSLGFSAGMAGVYTRRLLAAQDLVPGFEAGIMLAIAMACVFLAAQLLYVGLLRLIVGGRGAAVYLFESLSQFSAVLFAPYLAGVSAIEFLGLDRLLTNAGVADSMVGNLIEFEPLLLLAGFAVLHTLFKLFGLYAMLCANREARLPAVGWLLGSACFVYGALAAGMLWHEELLAAQVVLSGQTTHHRVGDVHARARQLPEGAVCQFELDPTAPRNMVLRWANLPEDPHPIDMIYVAISYPGTSADMEQRELPLTGSRWTTLRIDHGDIPDDARACQVIWTSSREPAWLLQTGLRPASGDARPLLLSGPHFHEPRAASQAPNLILLLVEGVGAEHVTSLGYERSTTPNIDAIAAGGLSFAQAYTPAPEVTAPAMSLLTGVNPLHHGRLGAQPASMPEDMDTLTQMLRARDYATAAFTEGEGADVADLVYGGGIERGFEQFNDHYPVEVVWRRSQAVGANPVVPAGSGHTLDLAAEWIEAHAHEKFFVFIRLRELRNPMWLRKKYGEGFVTAPNTPRPRDVFDTALAYVDEQIGAFYERLGEQSGLDNTLFVITAPYGQDFSAGWGAETVRGLTEGSLHVPLIFAMAGANLPPAATHKALVSLEDAAVAMAGLMRVRFPHAVTGGDLFNEAVRREPVAMAGNPLQLSLRTLRWRYTWQSGIEPFTFTPVADPAPVALVNIDWRNRNWRQGDNISKNPRVVATLTQQLRTYLSQHSRGRALGEPDVESAD
ncbi:MAG: sulfatase-like hydrolase/transferase [Candidatus Hydrogenedentota bacterium]